MIIKNIAIIVVLLLLTGCAHQGIKQGADAYARGNFDEAVKQWIPHAKNGDPYAQFNIGIMWEQGLGRTPLNTGEASHWYLLSAKQGYTPAMVRLGNLQRSLGYDVAALSWLVLAARWGNNDAGTALKDWGKDVPSADLLAQQQYNKVIADQQLADTILLSLTYFLSGVANSYSPAYQQSSAYLVNNSYKNIENGCSSDFACGIGNTCVKAPFKSTGVCMKSVSAQGLPVYNMPKSDSINIKTQGQCRFDTDCSIGFKCDVTYKACVK